jgi:hypothetical protein
VKAGQARAKAQGRPPVEDDYKLIRQVAVLSSGSAIIRAIEAELKKSPTTIHKLMRAAA